MADAMKPIMEHFYRNSNVRYIPRIIGDSLMQKERSLDYLIPLQPKDLQINVSGNQIQIVSGNIKEMDAAWSEGQRMYACKDGNEITISAWRGNKPGSVEITRDWSTISRDLKKNKLTQSLIEKLHF
jgi:hypothetical protein